MTTVDTLKKRRTYYSLDKNIKISEGKIEETVNEITKLVPDAFNMKSQRVFLIEGEKHDLLWDSIYEAFGGEVKREKIDTFKNAAGTVLFFYDKKTVEKMKKEHALYEKQFEPWALESNGMLQISVWNALEELGLGANLQHYNPVIDKMVKEMFDIDVDYVLLGQLVYGNIIEEPDAKEEDKTERFKIVK